VLVAACCAVLAMGGYALWLATLYGVRDSGSELLAEVDRVEREDAMIANAKGIAASLSTDEALVAEYFLDESELVPFLERIERSGQAFGSTVRVASVATGSGVDAGRVVLAVAIDGSFASVMQTLGTLEYGPLDIRTNSLSLAASGEEEGGWSAAATLSVGLRTASNTP
jgi:hypothetical protein